MVRGLCAPIEGLRAAAALAVVAFHARLAGFEGGFLGVELFFVLSGYLTARALAEGDAPLSLLRAGVLVLRRVRRLWPLLAVVLVLSFFVFRALGIRLPFGS